MMLWTVVDLVALVVILWISFDAVRELDGKDRPLRALPTILVAVGAFAAALHDLRITPGYGNTFLHTGLAIWVLIYRWHGVNKPIV